MENEQKVILILARRLQFLRQKKGLSKRKFAIELDMDERVIRRIEKGDHKLKVSILFRYAQYFELTIAELLQDVEKELLEE